MVPFHLADWEAIYLSRGFLLGYVKADTCFFFKS
jgi:hypothetical protein